MLGGGAPPAKPACQSPRLAARLRPMKPPSAAQLLEAALTHVARYASTEASLMRVLRRRLDRWARLQEGDAETIEAARAAA
jgi:regulatory protein